MTKYFTPLGLILLLLLSATFCSKGKQNKEKDHLPETNTQLTALEDKLDKMKRYLLNRRITSLDKILNTPTAKTGDRILLSYTGYDCSSCVEASFQLINGLPEKDKQRLIALAVSSPVGSDQLRYNFDQLIYTDANDWLRKELKYYYTPVIFMIDAGNIIRSVFFVTSFGDKQQQAADFYKWINCPVKEVRRYHPR